jgi:hypothetical protein
MATHRTIKINPGIIVCTESMTVTIDHMAFFQWPWSGKAWPCKTDSLHSVSFSFEENGEKDITLVGITQDAGHDEAMIGAMATDAKAILVACLHGCDFAVRNLFADRWHPPLEKAKDAGHRAGADSAEWIAQESFGGRTKDKEIVPNAKRFLAMHDEGDPALYDGLPCSPLSGEYAGDLLPKDLICDVLDLNDSSYDALHDFAQAIDMEDSLESLKDQICSSYEEEHSDAMMSRLVEIAQGIVTNDNENNATK